MDSYELGTIPKNIKELEIIKNNSLYPTFGSISQRTKWTNQINAIIKKNLTKNNIDFIEIKESLKKKNKKILFDKIHLSSNKIIKKIYSKIQNNIKMKINL
jgi:tRNA uridine 5-carbamoylmethylation protein Kti12